MEIEFTPDDNSYTKYKNTWNPLFFRLRDDSEKRDFLELVKSNPHMQIHDTIRGQIKELIKCKNPKLGNSDTDWEVEISKVLNNQHSNYYGVWVYYPWSGKIVHILDEKEFIEVRTTRNLYKITKQEREILAGKRVGILGLSVGQAVALALCTERICGTIKLADYDTLELSNMNRLAAGISDIDIPKTVIAARKILELDPFLKIQIFEEGINKDNLDEFLAGDLKLDILVEECDSIDMKILSRQAAQKHGIPVIMETNDKGMIDIERFDLEPSREIFHGLLTSKELDQVLTEKNPATRMWAVHKIINYENTSQRLKNSFEEIGSTITNWPQLATSVFIGAGATSNIIKRIFLGSLRSSGRFYFDIENIVPDDTKYNIDI